ncbi:MAG: cupin domain-containing protein [Kineosporiaceae bacterium]
MTAHRNPGAGEVYTIGPVTGPGAGEGDLRLVLELAAVHHPPPAHVHPHSDESFTVVDGELEVRVGRSWTTLGAGESATAPAGAPHAFRNSSRAPVRVEVLVVPGAAVRAFLHDLLALTDAGRVDRRGQLALPDAARLLRRHPDAVRLAGVPGPVQTGLLAVLSRLPGRLAAAT